MISDLLFRLRALFRRESMEAELDEELRSHLEHQIEKYTQSGMSAAEAESRARFDFGNVEQVKEECRESWGVKPFDQLAADVRCGLHWMSGSPGVALVTVLAIALGVFANTAIFDVLGASVNQLLPHQGTARIALASEHLEHPAKGHVVKPALVAWKVHKRTIERTASVARTRETRLSAAVSEPADLKVIIVTAEPFRMPGIQEIPVDAQASQYSEKRDGYAALTSEAREQTPPGPSLTVFSMTLHRGDVSYTFVEVIPDHRKFSSAGAQAQMPLRACAEQSERGNILTFTMRLKPTTTAFGAMSNL